MNGPVEENAEKTFLFSQSSRERRTPREERTGGREKPQDKIGIGVQPLNQPTASSHRLRYYYYYYHYHHGSSSVVETTLNYHHGSAVLARRVLL